MTDCLQLMPEKPVVISFTGPDAVRFLNGQITQDASHPGQASRTSCVTDAKGRLQYFVKVFAGPADDSLWITCTHGDGLKERLERYLIADEVEVEDLTGSWACIHSSIEPDGQDPAFVRSASGCFGEGFDCWWQTDSLPEIAPIDPQLAEQLRIRARIPRWGHELEAGMLPPEAGLDQTSISYTKGCYIGQEVLSRIKSAGKLNRRLAAFTIDGPVARGAELLIDGKAVGHLTSVAPEGPGDSGSIALGYLKKSGFDSETFQTSGSGESPIARLSGWA